jgi:hypothetical protein
MMSAIRTEYLLKNAEQLEQRGIFSADIADASGRSEEHGNGMKRTPISPGLDSETDPGL